MLDEVDWLLARKKSQTTSNKTTSTSGEETLCTPALSRGGAVLLSLVNVDISLESLRLPPGDATQADDGQDVLEKAVTLQLGTLVTALSELVQTPLVLGTASVTLLRALTRTYSTLTTLAKHVGSERPPVTPESFLLHDLCRPLFPLLFPQYVQACSGQQGAVPGRFEKLVSLTLPRSTIQPVCFHP